MRPLRRRCCRPVSESHAGGFFRALTTRSAEAVDVPKKTPVRPMCVWDCSDGGEKMDCSCWRMTVLGRASSLIRRGSVFASARSRWVKARGLALRREAAAAVDGGVTPARAGVVHDGRGGSTSDGGHADGLAAEWPRRVKGSGGA
jgi:hypothetical protein